MPRVEGTGLVELPDVRSGSRCVTGRGQDSPPQPPNPELRSVNKLAPPHPRSQLPLGAPLTSRSSPPSASGRSYGLLGLLSPSLAFSHTPSVAGSKSPHPLDGSGVTSSTRRLRGWGPNPGMGDRTEELGGELKKPYNPHHPSPPPPPESSSPRVVQAVAFHQGELLGTLRRREARRGEREGHFSLLPQE